MLTGIVTVVVIASVTWFSDNAPIVVVVGVVWEFIWRLDPRTTDKRYCSRIVTVFRSICPGNVFYKLIVSI